MHMLPTSPFTIALLSALAFATPSAPGAQKGQAIPADGNGLVHVQLLADHDAIVPGATTTLGIRLEIEPRWHIYWENPGDSGVPTHVDVRAPEGFEVGALHFPPPQRQELEGDIVSYIHEKEALLLVDVKAPSTLAQSSKPKFEVECRWLVCTDICVPGSGKAALELPVADADHPVHAANEKLFADARSRQPKPWSALASASFVWSGDESAPSAAITVMRATSLEFFPYTSDSTNVAGRKLSIGAHGSKLAL